MRNQTILCSHSQRIAGNTLPASALLVALALLLCAGSASAANGTWTNAPASGEWTNVLNWHGGTVPGAINNTANNGVDTASIASFTNAIPDSLIGSAANPVIPDDATVANGKARMVYRLNFDGSSCGSYVFYSPSPYAAQTATTPETGVLSLCVSTANGGANGSYIGAAVTNPQTFLIPVQIRLPSSTTGTYGFTNNAASPNATYFLDRLFLYPGATGRGVTFVFAGSNTGTNTVASLAQSANQTGGPSGIRKEGSGTWILSGANTFNAASSMLVTAGTLIVKNPSAFGSATTATVNNTGVLQIDGVSLLQMYLTLNSGGTVRMNGTASVNGVAVGTAPGTTGTLSTTSADDVFTVGTGIATGTYVTGGTADTVLNTAGPGTLVFNTGNSYAGRWNFAAKTNQIGDVDAFGGGANVNVAAGAILDFTPLGGSSITPTNGGFGGSGTGTAIGSTAAALMMDASGLLDLNGKTMNLTFTPTGFAGDASHPSLVVIQGTLQLGGNTFFVNNASGTPLGIGTYRLIQAAGGSITAGGGNVAIVTGSGLAFGTAASVSVSGGNVDLVVTAYTPKNLVWKGGNPDAVWNVGATANFLDGAANSVFTSSDNVTFNSMGSANPVVTLSGTLAPTSLTVDTSANDYTFGGTGSIAGPGSLAKVGTGSLALQTVNTYVGGTIVSNGTVQLGANNALSSTGTGDVSVYGGGKIDLNTFSCVMNALVGNGTVDSVGGGTPVLTLGNNDRSGAFAGAIQNTAGTLGVTKIGAGTQLLGGASSYGGPTLVSGGTLAAANSHALGVNSDLTVGTGATLDVQSTELRLNSLAGSGGSIVNNSTSTTNRIIITGSSSTTWSGSMSDGAGGGAMALTVLGGTLTIGANNTYSGGTIVASGATFNINNSPAGVTGPLMASNNATLGLVQGSGTPTAPSSITTVDGGTVIFTAGALGKIWGGQFIGSANTTNRITTTMSFGGDSSFKDFHGVVRLEAAADVRFINIPTGAWGGGEDTTFEWATNANVMTRDPVTVRLGHIVGGNVGGGIGGASGGGTDTYILGGKGLDSTFHGYVRGANNIVKSGAGRLAFDGWAASATNTDSATYTNYLFTSALSYTGNTTISNGVLALFVPNDLSNSPSITLASASAVLDATQMGIVSNFTDLNGDNSALVTNGTLYLYSPQTLSGIGTIQGNLVAEPGTTVAPGLSAGVLTVSGAVALNGTVNLELDRSASPNSDQINATSITVEGATINVANIGPDCITGDVYQLFNHAVTGTPLAVNLPAQNASGSVAYSWTNMLALDGTIRVLSGASPINPTPTNVIASVSGNELSLSWPDDYKGWELQTNAVSIADANAWYAYPGSTGTNQMIITINPAASNVFYRMHHVIP